jgi:hypothetical protein
MDRSGSNTEIQLFLVSLAEFDDMDLVDFFRRLRGERKQPAKQPVAAKVNVNEIVSRLKSSMPNDDAFHRVIDALNSQKAVTKPVLTQVFYALFNRTKGVPSKASRADLLRLIEDERNILVRNQKMGEMLGRRPVPAE